MANHRHSIFSSLISVALVCLLFFQLSWADVKFFTLNVFENDVTFQLCAYTSPTTQICPSSFSLDYAYYRTVTFTTSSPFLYNLTASARYQNTNTLLGNFTFPGNITSYNFFLAAFIEDYNQITSTKTLGLGGYAGSSDETVVSVLIANFFYAYNNALTSISSTEYDTFVYDTNSGNTTENIVTIPQQKFLSNNYKIFSLCSTLAANNSAESCYLYTTNFQWVWTFLGSRAYGGSKSLINANAGQMVIVNSFGYYYPDGTY
jgi:hypothetical protein